MITSCAVFAAHAGADRGDQDPRGRQERQVAVEFPLDHRRVGAELVEHGQERLDLPVDREERVGQRDPSHHRAEHVALVPLRARQLGGHRRIAAQHDLQAVDPLAGTGVHLVRHRRRADLPWREALGHQFVARHQPDGVRQRRRARPDLHQRRDDVVVQRPRIHLPHAGEHVCEAEEFGHPPFELGQLVGVAVEQVEHVLRGAHRTLDAAQRVPVDQRTQPGQRNKHLLGCRSESLAQRGGLRGDVVAAASHHQVAVADRPLGQPSDDGHAVRKDQLKRPADLQLLNVFGEVATRHALVHMLVARQRVELLDAGLDVVAQHAFPRGDRRQVDVVETRS